MTTWTPLPVEIVRDDNGTHIEPPLCVDASRIDQLRWRTGVIEARTGVRVDLTDMASASGPGYSYQFPRLIGVIIRGADGSTSTNQFDSDIWNYLNGIENGAVAAMGRDQ